MRYEVAADFGREFAADLSRGGMFIRGGRGLVRHRDVMVEIDLPGYGIYEVRAEVAHVISAEQALQQRRTAGAGLSILEAPDGSDGARAPHRRAARAAGPPVVKPRRPG